MAQVHAADDVIERHVGGASHWPAEAACLDQEDRHGFVEVLEINGRLRATLKYFQSKRGDDCEIWKRQELFVWRQMGR